MHDYMMMIMGVAIGRKSELIQFEFRPTEFFFVAFRVYCG